LNEEFYFFLTFYFFFLTFSLKAAPTSAEDACCGRLAVSWGLRSLSLLLPQKIEAKLTTFAFFPQL